MKLTMIFIFGTLILSQGDLLDRLSLQDRAREFDPRCGSRRCALSSLGGDGL